MGCDGALIQDTTITNGDDSICMKGGAKNVLVRNCSVSNGAEYAGNKFHGLAGGLVLGTDDARTRLHDGGVDDTMRNITFTNCTV